MVWEALPTSQWLRRQFSPWTQTRCERCHCCVQSAFPSLASEYLSFTSWYCQTLGAAPVAGRITWRGVSRFHCEGGSESW